MLTHAEFQTFLFTFEIAVGSEDTCKELWSKAQNTTIYSLPFDWDLKFKSILKSYYKRVLNSTVVIVLLNVCGRKNFTATEDVKFIYKIKKIRRNPLPQHTTENASWRFMGFLNSFRKYFISLHNDRLGRTQEGQAMHLSCWRHRQRWESSYIWKPLQRVSSFLAIISTLNAVHTETLLEHSLSYSCYTFVPLPLASASSMLWDQQGIHFSLHRYHSCTLCPFTAFSGNSLSQAKESSFWHLSVLAEAISFPGKQLSDFLLSTLWTSPQSSSMQS